MWSDFNEEVKGDSYVSRQGPTCKTCKLLSALAGEAAEEIERAFASLEITSASIRRALLNRVDPRQVPSTYSLARHRRGDCRIGSGGPK